jgi:hypothetical protein
MRDLVIKLTHLGARSLIAVAPFFFAAPAFAQSPPPSPSASPLPLEIDPPPLPIPPLPPAHAGVTHEEPPTPAHPHTELQSGPPSAAQSDPWPVVPKASDAVPTYPAIRPYASIVGGAVTDIPIQYQVAPGQTSNLADRVSTIMMSDFGVRGALLPWISFESELMANGGISLHGTSVFEGQASLQIRKQVIHLGKDWWTVEVGRIVDEASVDYFSYHIADCFLMDPATEPFLLFDGFNLGNGLRATAEPFKGLRLGLNLNAGDVTSNSAVFAFGGPIGAYPSVFGDASSSVQASATSYPQDQFQDYVITPSVMYKNKYFEAKGALQYFFINLDADGGKAPQPPTIRGYNLRFNAAAHIADDLVMPFVNVNYGENDTVSAADPDAISANRYTGIGIGGGVDLNYQRKNGNYNGVGVMFVEDESQVGPTGTITRSRYYNVGTTYWIAPMVAAGLRYSEYTNEQLNTSTGQPLNGNRSVLLTLRLVL